MSFILDALKKSETDRQEQASAEFAAIPAAVDEPGPPRWIWVLGALLLVNVAVLAVVVLDRDDAIAPPPSERAATESVDPRPPAATSEPSFTERLDVASRSRPAPRPERETIAEPAPATTATTATPRRETTSEVQQPVLESSSLALPTLTEIRLDGVDLPDLNLDIHVYGRTSAERFVFVNMQKHQEGSTLESGPRIEAITPDGVILDYRGTRFVLPRE